LVGRQQADGDDGHQHVEGRRDKQRADDRDRQVALGALGLLAAGRDRFEAEEGEEDQRRGVEDAVEALGRERLEVIGREGGQAGDMKKISVVILTVTMMLLRRVVSRMPLSSSTMIAATISTARRLNVPPASGERW
jgi:hypothetical protein